MSLASYQIVCISPFTGETTIVYDSTAFIDLRYSRELNDIGLLAMTLPGSDLNYSIFSLDTLVEVRRTDPQTGDLAVEETYLARLRHRYRTDDDEFVVIGGVSLNHLLLRRIVDPDDDPLAAGGYSTKAGFTSEVIRDYIREQAADQASADRRFPGLTVPAVAGIGQQAGARLRYEVLLDAMKDLAARGSIDFWTRRTSGANMQVEIGVIGADRTKTTHDPVGQEWLGLSPQRGNLTRPSLREDRKDEANFVYALGQGQGTSRTVLKVAGAGVADSPYNRVEFSQDIRNAEKGDALTLLTAAQAELASRISPLEFKFEPNGFEAGNVYRRDWDIGDLVTIFWGDVMRDIRITGVEINVSEDGEELQISVKELPS